MLNPLKAAYSIFKANARQYATRSTSILEAYFDNLEKTRIQQSADNSKEDRKTVGKRTLREENSEKGFDSEDFENSTANPASGFKASEYLQNLSGVELKKLKLIKLEYEQLYQEGRQVPEVVSDDIWAYLVQFGPTLPVRLHAYNYFYRKERNRHQREDEKQLKLQSVTEQKLPHGEAGVKWTLTWFLQSNTINEFHNANIAHSAQFGPYLVFDMTLCNQMSPPRISQLCTQLQNAHAVNKQRRTPFYFVFAGVDPRSPYYSMLTRSQDAMSPSSYYIVTDKPVDQVFPASELVYITPNARSVLSGYDYNSTYILSGLAVVHSQSALQLSRAKELGVRAARIPYERYYRVKGDKNLPTNLLTSIIAELYDSQDMRAALKHFPHRKIKN